MAPESVGRTATVGTDSWADDEAAASRAKVSVRVLDGIAQMRPASDLLDGIWGASNRSRQVDPRLMVAIAEAGGYVAGAFDGTQIVAAAVGFPRHPSGLHSHIAGVDPAFANRGVGTALKLHQRAWCLDRGILTVTWTFDPLVARNAHLNLTRLGATVEKYLVDVYGSMNDALNRDDPSDRLLVRWDLAATGHVEPDELGGSLLVDERGGEPVVTARRGGEPGRLLVAVPADIASLRRTNPSAAKRWRSAVRDALSPALADGWLVEGFDRTGHYVLGAPR